MDRAAQVQILDKTVCISLGTNNIEISMNATILSPAMGK